MEKSNIKRDINSPLTREDWDHIFIPAHNNAKEFIMNVNNELSSNFIGLVEELKKRRINNGIYGGHKTMSDFLDRDDAMAFDSKVFDFATALDKQFILKDCLCNIMNFYDKLKSPQQVISLLDNRFENLDKLIIELYVIEKKPINSSRILNFVSQSYMNENPDLHMIEPPSFLSNSMIDVLSNSQRNWKEVIKCIELLGLCDPENYKTQDISNAVEIFFGNQLPYLNWVKKNPHFSKAIDTVIPRERITIDRFSFDKKAMTIFNPEVVGFQKDLDITYCKKLNNFIKCMIELESLRTLKDITIDPHKLTVNFYEVEHTDDPINTKLDYSRILNDKSKVDSLIQKITNYADNIGVKTIIEKFAEGTGKLQPQDIKDSCMQLIDALELSEKIEKTIQAKDSESSFKDVSPFKI